MAGLNLNHIYKVYPNGVKAVNDFNMEIEDKEFIVFVGPSGCGKSTTLRMVAGLEEISAGELKIDGKVVNDIEPKDRDIAMVFQNYALYPHMTVYNNMAFGLKLHKVPCEERDKSYKAKKADGTTKSWFALRFGRVPMELRDEKGNLVYDAEGRVQYAVKKRKDGTDKLDKEGKPVYAKRWHTDEERLGRIVVDENGNPVLIPKRRRDGSIAVNKNGETLYKMRKHTREEIRIKVTSAAAILDILPYLDRKPAAMSGGQRQRVALGRAIVRNPKVFLLDEPLSNLDAKLRTAMRSEISKLHRKLQTTFIYVTHDQVEAMTMGTRIVVMKGGYIQQIDSPQNLYNYPCNKFVAGFIGTPQMNFFNGKIAEDGDNLHITFDGTEVALTAPKQYFEKADNRYFDGKKTVTIGIRCEHISVDPDEYPCRAKCRVSFVEELGLDCQVYADFDTVSEETVADSATRVIIKAPADTHYEIGEIIEVSLDLSHAHIFDSETEATIAPRIPERHVFECEVKDGKLTLLGTQFKLPAAISLADGSYKAVVPIEALKEGCSIGVSVVSSEVINGKTLLRLKASENIVFLLSENKDIKGIDIDLKLLTFIGKDGEIALNAFDMVNSLPGKVSKHKKAREGGKGKVTDYILDLCGKGIVCVNDEADKLEGACGQMLVSEELECKFSPYDVEFKEDGLEATVTRIVDYGGEIFAECTIDGEVLRLSVDKDFNCKVIRFAPKADKIMIIRTYDGVRIV